MKGPFTLILLLLSFFSFGQNISGKDTTFNFVEKNFIKSNEDALKAENITIDSVVKDLSYPHHDSAYHKATEMPEFPGGQDAMHSYLMRTLQYPQEARKGNKSGQVTIQFIVETDGSITNVKVIKKAGYFLDAEAVRVIKNMPKWKPGKLNGKNVRVYYLIPISFSIQ